MNQMAFEIGWAADQAGGSGTSTSATSTVTYTAACTPKTVSTESRSSSCKNDSGRAGKELNSSEPSFRHPHGTVRSIEPLLGERELRLAIQLWRAGPHGML
jgi:hypothetical protein